MLSRIYPGINDEGKYAAGEFSGVRDIEKFVPLMNLRITRETKIGVCMCVWYVWWRWKAEG